jgi:hypothetical protein
MGIQVLPNLLNAHVGSPLRWGESRRTLAFTGPAQRRKPRTTKLRCAGSGGTHSWTAPSDARHQSFGQNS